jgi:hypothetical protein
MRLTGFGCVRECPGIDFVFRDQPALLDHVFERREPDLIIAHRQIFSGRPVLAREPSHVDVPAAGHAHGEREREGALLPFCMEHWFVRLGRDRAMTVCAAEILRAVHFAMSFGDFGRPVPIMESRVTRSANFSSLQLYLSVVRNCGTI